MNTLKFKYATLNDAISELAISESYKDFAKFCEMICKNSRSRLQLDLDRNSYGHLSYSVNGGAHIVFEGYNFAYCCNLLLDSLRAAGYFD